MYTIIRIYKHLIYIYIYIYYNIIYCKIYNIAKRRGERKNPKNRNRVEKPKSTKIEKNRSSTEPTVNRTDGYGFTSKSEPKNRTAYIVLYNLLYIIYIINYYSGIIGIFSGTIQLNYSYKSASYISLLAYLSRERVVE